MRLQDNKSYPKADTLSVVIKSEISDFIIQM